MPSDTEARLTRIWSDCLGIDAIAPDDNFFQLGGHSLLAADIMVSTCAEFGISLPAKTVFAAPTIAELARAVEAERVNPTPASVIPRVERRPVVDPAS